MINKEFQAEFVKDIRDKTRLSQRNFAKELDCSGSYIGQVETGETALSDKVYNKIVEKFGYLLNAQQGDNCIALPVRGNLQASLGHGIEIIDEGTTGRYWINNKLLKQLGISKQCTDFVPCEGDSMFPTIDGGCLLMVDKSRKEVLDGKIYCIRLNNNLMAKRLQFIPPHSIKVISDNKDKYDPFYVDLSKEIGFDFEIIGEVKWWGTIAK